MKSRLLYIIAVALLLSAAITSCEKDENQIKDMTMSLNDNYIYLQLDGFGTVTVDWGDGSPAETSTLSKDIPPVIFRHSYSDKKEHTIKIFGDGVTMLYCHSGLTSLNVSKNTALSCLRCSSNKLTSLDVSRNYALTHLECGTNQLTNLILGKKPVLKKLYCSSNKIENLDVSKCTALTTLDCCSNPLSSLDLKRNPALEELWCLGNQLTRLDVSNNVELTEIYCSDNSITSLYLSKNAALEKLYCMHNQLTSLDMRKNTRLRYLRCEENQLSAKALDALFSTLHSKITSGKMIAVRDNPGADTCNPSIATEKGWIVSTSWY